MAAILPQKPAEWLTWRFQAAFLGSALLIGCTHAVTAKTSTQVAASPQLARFTSPYSYEWFVRAEVLFARAQYAAAADAYRNALAGAEEDALLYARLARALDRAGDRDGAAEALEEGSELDPHSEAVWLARGEIADGHGEAERAREAFTRAQESAPDSDAGVLALFELLRKHGHAERAVLVLERFAARHPTSHPRALRARLLLAVARGDGDALVAAASAFQKHGGGDGALMRQAAAELLAHGRAALAWRMLQALPASDEDARLRLSILLALAEHAQVGLLLATTPPSQLGGPIEVAEAYLRIGLPERALLALDEQDRQEDTDPHRRALLRGEVLTRLGKPGEAALLLAGIPRSSAFSARANLALRHALEAGGLPELAREVEAAQRLVSTP